MRSTVEEKLVSLIAAILTLAGLAFGGIWKGVNFLDLVLATIIVEGTLAPDLLTPES